jgi:hypothetical protein
MKKVLFFLFLAAVVLSLPACKHLKCDRHHDDSHSAA